MATIRAKIDFMGQEYKVPISGVKSWSLSKEHVLTVVFTVIKRGKEVEERQTYKNVTSVEEVTS